MGDVAEEKFLGAHEGLEAFGHVIEVVDEALEFVGVGLLGGGGRLLDACGQVAVGEGARGFPHADEGAGEEQDEDEGGEATDGDGDGELREGEVEIGPAALWGSLGGRRLQPEVFVARAVGRGEGD